MSRPTRGRGLLEPLLARLRADKVEELLSTLPDLQRTRILDIGCGRTATLLQRLPAQQRIGIDQEPPSEPRVQGVQHIVYNVASSPHLPFKSACFDAVVMSAVVEHLAPATGLEVIAEARRVLRLGGRLILTTPSSVTPMILKSMAALGLVSSAEIDEHQTAYSRDRLVDLLVAGGFQKGKVVAGTFELGMNLWSTAEKADETIGR